MEGYKPQDFSFFHRSEKLVQQSVPGEALIFGNCVPMPLQVQVIQAKPDPNSKNCDVEKEWFIKK